MASLLDKFSVCRRLPSALKTKIKLIHVFDDQREYNALFITGNDLCYGVGANAHGSLGLGHNNPIPTHEMVPELSRQGVRRFCTGMDFALALNNKGQVFGWGRNDRCQLARPRTKSDDYLRPKTIPELKHCRIVEISCGFHHSLALTDEGQVYGWGRNTEGAVGVGNRRRDRVSRATPLPFPHPFPIVIKSVYCYNYSSFALAEDGRVYSWGFNGNHQLGHHMAAHAVPHTPQLILKIADIKTVCPSGRSTHFLANDGRVYFCGTYVADNAQCDENGDPLREVQLEPKLVDIPAAHTPHVSPDSTDNEDNDSDNSDDDRDSHGSGGGNVGVGTPRGVGNGGRGFDDFQQLVTYQRLVSVPMALRGDRVYAIMDNNRFEATDYDNFVDFYADQFELTYRTVRLAPDGKASVDDVGAVAADGAEEGTSDDDFQKIDNEFKELVNRLTRIRLRPRNANQLATKAGPRGRCH